jgi:hypothetical protein
MTARVITTIRGLAHFARSDIVIRTNEAMSNPCIVVMTLAVVMRGAGGEALRQVQVDSWALMQQA